MICAARRDTDPEAVTCSSALPKVGGKQTPCACGVAVKDAIKLDETRQARVPDSAREEAS